MSVDIGYPEVYTLPLPFESLGRAGEVGGINDKPVKHGLTFKRFLTF
jgi:hypothetical protein